MSSTRRYRNILSLPVVEPISISFSPATLVMYQAESYLWCYLHSDWSRVRIAGLRWQWPMLLHNVVTDHRTINVLHLVWTSLRSTVKSITTPVAFSLYLNAPPTLTPSPSLLASSMLLCFPFSFLRDGYRKCVWCQDGCEECRCEGLYILWVVVTLDHVRYRISCSFEWSEVRFPRSFAFVTPYGLSNAVDAVNKTRNVCIT